MMHAKGFFIFIVLINFSLLLVIHCQQCNKTECGTTASPVPEETSVQKGMDTFFKMMNSFLEIVIKHSVYSSDGEFNIKKFRQILNTSSTFEGIFESSWEAALHDYGLLFACAIFGLIMPTCCWCYKCCLCSCCCRKCCGKGKTDSDPKNAKCKRITISMILIACTTMMLLGTIIACLSAQLLHTATSNTDKAGFVGRFDASVKNFRQFISKAVENVPGEANKAAKSGLDEVEGEINGFANSVADTVIGRINATSLLDQAEALGKASREAFGDLKNVTESLKTLVDMQTNINSELHDIKTKIDAVCPNSSNPQWCNTSGLQLKVNFLGLNNLTDQFNKSKDAQNISQAVADVRQKVAHQVSSTQVQGPLNKARDQVSSVRTQVQAKLKNISSSVNPVIDFLNSSLNWTDRNKDLINEIGNYTWYGTTSLSCVFMLSVLLYYIGILLGLCGKRPDGQSCNKETGANCIMAGNIWALMFFGLLMLIVTLLFITAGAGYAMGCRYLNGGVEGIKTLEPLKDANLWPDGASPENISSALENCKENKGLYTAIHLIDKTINLEELINMTEINMYVRQVANMDISGINLMTSELEEQLHKFGNTKLDGINFQGFFDQTDLGNVAGTNLSQFALSLNAAAENANNSNIANSLRQQSYRLVLLMENQIAQFSAGKDLLGKRVRSLQEKSNLTTQTKSLQDNIRFATDYFINHKKQTMQQALDEAINTVLGNINITVSNVMHQLKNDIGGCRPAYDAVQGISDSVCITVLNPLNGFWFGLGCTLFFFIPSTIFGDILNWLLRKKQPYKKYESDDSPDRNAYSRDYQEKMPESHGPHAYSGYVPDNIPLRHLPHASSGNFQERMPERLGPPIAYSGYVQENIPLRQYPQGAITNVYDNPGFVSDLNRQSLAAGRPQQDGYIDYREMTSNHAVVRPASRQASYCEQPGKPY